MAVPPSPEYSPRIPAPSMRFHKVQKAAPEIIGIHSPHFLSGGQ
jgi:hypothetical protein